MNLFTRFLKQWLHDSDLEQLVEHCDALEALVIRVYKREEATAADEAEYQALRRWMEANYPQWQSRLRPHWREAKVAGEAATADPFLQLTAATSAGEFVGNWKAMQHLPAAREALNKLVLQLGEET